MLNKFSHLSVLRNYSLGFYRIDIACVESIIHGGYYIVTIREVLYRTEDLAAESRYILHLNFFYRVKNSSDSIFTRLPCLSLLSSFPSARDSWDTVHADRQWEGNRVVLLEIVTVGAMNNAVFQNI